MADGVLTVEASGATDAVLSPDQSKLYVALASGDVDSFDLASGQKLGTWHVNASLGAISVSPDGSFLLLNDARQPVAYQISTANGALLHSFTGSGNAFTDVQAISTDRAIVTGTQPSTIDIASGTFTPIVNATSYSGYSILTTDGSLTLFGETGISDGPLAVFDNASSTIVARGDDYQSPNSGSNFGSQAISSSAGEIAQFIYSYNINFYDLNVHYLRSFRLDNSVAGISFDLSGSHLFTYGQNGAVSEYDSKTLQQLLTVQAEPTTIDSSAQNFGNAISVTNDDRYAIVVDYNSATQAASGVVQIIDLSKAPHQIAGTNSADTLIGTSADEYFIGGSGADTLTGGGGTDTFQENSNDAQGDHIVDFTVGDVIRLTDNSYNDIRFFRNGSSLQIYYGSFEQGQFAATSYDSLDIGSTTARLITQANGSLPDLIGANHWAGLADFDGDGHSDILWQNGSGVSSWLVAGNTQPDQVTQSVFNAGVAPSWHATDTFDMNGDSRADILWRNDDGSLAVWQSNGRGFSATYLHGSVGTDWRVAAVGDVNGDGKDDLLWQNSNGSISLWTSTGTGFNQNTYFHASPGPGWQVEALGDFTGDGKADILWRNSDGGISTWNSFGDRFQEGGFFISGVPTSWHIVGVGDFNGDNQEDILWRNDNGAVSIWRGDGNNFDQSVYNTVIGSDQHVVSVGDFNNDGKADILWRSDNGGVSIWQSTGDAFTPVSYSSSATTDWHVVSHTYVL